MNELTIDFETRSKCDIRKAGAWRYAMDESTEIFNVAVKLNDERTRILIRDPFKKLLEEYYRLEGTGGYNIRDAFNLITEKELFTLIHDADTIEAHNMEFETAIWGEVGVKKYGWPELPKEKLRCSAAKAAAKSIPRALGKACDALNLPVTKDIDGHTIMLRVSKPKKPSKKDPSIWDESPEKLEKLFKYGCRDVDSERGLSKRLPDLDSFEQEVWKIDQKINRRGIHIDEESVRAIIAMVKQHESKLLNRMAELTDKQVKSPRQTQATLDWLESKGVKLPNIQKETVNKALKRKDLPDEVKEVLGVRQVLGKSSVSKYETMLSALCDDGRIRGTTMYCGAGTGRWAGKLIQPHNMPRGTYPDAEECLSAILRGDLEMVDLFYDDVFTTASKLLRAVICAPEGKDLICADYSSIEMVVLSWLSSSSWKVNAIREGVDLYKVAASGTYGVKYHEVAKDQRQIGKVQELALGYQGGWRAFESMSKNYGVQPPPDIVLAEMPTHEERLTLTEDELKAREKAYKSDWYENGKKLPVERARFKKWAKPLVEAWRENNPDIVQLWRDYNDAVLETVKTGKSHRVGRIRFGVKDNFLLIRLPSGRKLSYYDPRIESKLMPWKRMVEIDGEEVEEDVYRDAVTHMSNTTEGWRRVAGYGGRWVENVVQAIARDILAEALLRVEDAGYPVVMHVHDEIVAEIKKGFGGLKDFTRLMSIPPLWAKDCPISADGWRGKRYRK